MVQSRHTPLVSTGNAVSRSGLGAFEKLPFEIRSLIYHECIQAGTICLSHLSRELSREFIQALDFYVKNAILVLEIRPAARPLAIAILTQLGGSWKRYPIMINAASPHPYSELMNPLRAMPVGRFRAIHIIVEPPNPEDQGQALNLFMLMSAVVTSFLAKWPSYRHWPRILESFTLPAKMKIGTHLPPISIRFRENVAAASSSLISWTTDNKWHQSLPDFAEGWSDSDLLERDPFTDIRLALQPLESLRRARSIDIHLPQGPPTPRLAAFCERITRVASLETDFGLLPWVADINDVAILQRLSALQLWHNYLLDDLPGKTADLMRGERLGNWCTTYEVRLYNALYGYTWNPRGSKFKSIRGPSFGEAYEEMSIDLHEIIQDSFHDRFWSKVAFEDLLADFVNPGARIGPKSSGTWPQPHYTPPKASLDGFGHDIEYYNSALEKFPCEDIEDPVTRCELCEDKAFSLDDDECRSRLDLYSSG